ncbi:IS982 family transposase [Rhizosphaericola mali]|uniref:IS982 family transposase n=1 Tax=Rhizosphaericola mali TaxID=2545455 RepID=A0A5P2GDI9_9BACT|nr:IS982 family transposase [Rhizosphaericola mali]QES89671.1 IS982 family transposase [Rhizosphaericola mali]
MNHLIQNYEIILKTLAEFPIIYTPYLQIRRPKLSNMECIALGLTSEFMSIDSENQLFRMLKGTNLEYKIDRSVFNRRRKMLFLLTEQVRQHIANILNETEQFFIVDSIPLDICKMSRASRSTVCREYLETAPSKGFCASQNRWFYRYKIHTVISASGTVQHFDMTCGAVHDVHFLKDVQAEMRDCTIIGDKGYIAPPQQLDLFRTVNIQLEVPMRANQHNYNPPPHIIRKTRKRIETFFSQLCAQFMIQRNFSKSFNGFKTRILNKITATTIIQFLKKTVFQRNINNLKINIA